MMNRKERRCFAVFQKKLAAAGGVAPAGDPVQVRTHDDVNGVAIDTFSDFLRRPMPDVQHTQADNAFLLADYCRQSLLLLERVVAKLVHETGFVSATPITPFLQPAEVAGLKRLRTQWDEHLRAHKYGLWHIPPLSGGTTASYSLGAQLWLLIAHANVIMQQGGALSEMGSFYPPSSAYLSRNRLVLDNARTVDYPLRTLVMTIENFICRLDALEGGRDIDYARFTAALEHSASALACFQYDSSVLNAAEWCQAGSSAGKLRVSERFLVSCLVWFATLRDYAENYMALDHGRIPMEQVRAARWFPGASSLRSQSAFLCRYSFDHMSDEVNRSAVRDFLRQFQLRPSDMDHYRISNHLNEAPITSVRTHHFDHTSNIVQAYLYHVHFERAVNEYVCEALQWRDGERSHTCSASLGVQRLIAELAVLFVWHQFLLSKFRFDFKSHCFMCHRDPSFITGVVKARIGTPFAIVVQQFAHFSVIVPAHGRHAQQRVYDCASIFEALALWSLWTLCISGGEVDRGVNLRTFFYEIYGQAQMEARIERAR